MSQVLKCKQLHAQGASIRAIARDLDISRNTVRQYVRGERQPGEYRQSGPRSQPARDKIRSKVEEMLKSEDLIETPRKQRLTASRVHRLLEQQGLVVSAVTVRRLVAEIRLDLQDPLARAYLPLRYDPGHDGQVDFFEAVVEDESGVQAKVLVLLVRACFSGRTFAYAAPNQTREALLELTFRTSRIRFRRVSQACESCRVPRVSGERRLPAGRVSQHAQCIGCRGCWVEPR